MYDMNEWCGRLIVEEGLSLMPYLGRGGKVCLGAGRNLEENPLSYKELRAMGDFVHGITPNGAKMLLRNDIKRCFFALKHVIYKFEELDLERQYALLDMCFVIGIKEFKRLKAFRNAIGVRNFEKAAFECLQSAYGRLVPKRAERVALAIKSGVRQPVWSREAFCFF